MPKYFNSSSNLSGWLLIEIVETSLLCLDPIRMHPDFLIFIFVPINSYSEEQHSTNDCICFNEIEMRIKSSAYYVYCTWNSL